MAIKLHLHPVGLVLIFLGLISFVIALGGLASSTNFCYKVNVAGYCGQLFQLEWYSIFLELALLVAMLITCFLDAFERGRYIYLSYLSMATFFLSIMARNFITNSFKAGAVDLQDLHTDAYYAAAAGAIMLCVVNYALIIFIGLGATMDLPSMQALSNIRIGGYGFGPAQQKYQPSSTEGF